MKKIILILLLGFFSCSNSEELVDECGCLKTTYFYKDMSTQYIEYIDTYVIDVELIKCSEPVKGVEVSENIFYNIKCD